MSSLLLGVYVSEQQLRKISQSAPNDNTKALINANKIKKYDLFFFSLSKVNLALQQIQGYYYNYSEGAFKSKVYTYPNVLYTRGGSGGRDPRKHQVFINQLRAINAKHINSQTSFNKWSIFTLLEKEPQLRPFLPLTQLYISEATLTNMLDQNPKLYLKACRGSKGKQIFQVQKLAKNSFQYKYYRYNRLKKARSNYASLNLKIKDFFKQGNFIVQQAIDLIQTEASICDFRAELQRNGRGELEIVAVLARISQPGAPITQHSQSYLFDEFYLKFMGHPAGKIKTLKEKINRFLVTVYETIEKSYGPYGEIGIDFALDKEGKLWFIECNSQPAKVSLRKAADNETILRAYLNPIEYANFLHETKTKSQKK